MFSISNFNFFPDFFMFLQYENMIYLRGNGVILMRRIDPYVLCLPIKIENCAVLVEINAKNNPDKIRINNETNIY
jgi:hypothetical protein